MAARRSNNVKVQVTLTRDQSQKIKRLKSTMGDSESEIIRTIVAHWLIDHNK